MADWTNKWWGMHERDSPSKVVNVADFTMHN